jgi:AraC-like DNA-binding protein
MMAKSDTINIVKDYIEKHLSEKLDLNKIASIAGYSKFHLNRLFADTTGCTIHQYIQRRRLEESAKLLTSSNLPIIEIAFLSGYDSQQSFAFAFKKLYRNTPQTYRRRSGLLTVRKGNISMLNCGVAA